MNRRVLIVSPHFPPVNAPDMQRVRVALPYFVAAGWDVTVLTVADPTPTAPLEPELEATVPAAVRVVRARCCSRRWTGLLGFSNVALRSLPFLFLAGCRLLAGRRYDVIYFSTTMFSVLPLGRLWQMLHGVPYVIDLQDPWVSDFYDRPGAPPPPGGWKYGIIQALARRLEGWTLPAAAGLITVSAAYLATLRLRYPNLHEVPGTEIPFGSPDPDLAHLRATLDRRPALLPTGSWRLAFAGALGPGQLAAVEVLFAALAAARPSGGRVTVHFFGTSYDPAARPVTLALAAKYGLQDCVHEQPGRLRYFEALQVTLEAEVNLLFGSTDLPFTPSKLLAVLAAGRPVLALAPEGSAMIARLTGFGQPCVTFPATGPATGANEAVMAQLRRFTDRQSVEVISTALANGSAQAVADRQMAVLAAATATAI